MKINRIPQLFFALALSLSFMSFTTVQDERSEVSESKTSGFQYSLNQLINSSKIKLSVDKKSDANLRIVLKDEKGQIYFSQVMGRKVNYYRQIFDVTDMADGTYYFEISSRKERVIKELAIGTRRDRVIALQ